MAIQDEVITGSWMASGPAIRPMPTEWIPIPSGLPKERVLLELDHEIPAQFEFIPLSLQGNVVTYIMLEKFEDGNWIASLSEQRSVFAEGKNEQEAILNLVQSAAEDYTLLYSRRNKLAPHLAAELKSLSRLFDIDA